MSVGKHGPCQAGVFIPAADIAHGAGHAFHTKLNEVLARADFEQFAEELCGPYRREGGRPGIPLGVWFGIVLVWYFKGLDRQRRIAWRRADSLALREFLGFPITKTTSVDLRQCLMWVVESVVGLGQALVVPHHKHGTELAGFAASLLDGYVPFEASS